MRRETFDQALWDMVQQLRPDLPEEHWLAAADSVIDLLRRDGHDVPDVTRLGKVHDYVLHHIRRRYELQPGG